MHVNQVWDLFLTHEGHKPQLLDSIIEFIVQAIVSIERGANDGMRDLLDHASELVFAARSAPP
jgi:hypothetical protein